MKENRLRFLSSVLRDKEKYALRIVKKMFIEGINRKTKI